LHEVTKPVRSQWNVSGLEIQGLTLVPRAQGQGQPQVGLQPRSVPRTTAADDAVVGGLPGKVTRGGRGHPYHGPGRL